MNIDQLKRIANNGCHRNCASATMAEMARELLELKEKEPRQSMADALIKTIDVNVDNKDLTDAAFREFVKNTVATLDKHYKPYY